MNVPTMLLGSAGGGGRKLPKSIESRAVNPRGKWLEGVSKAVFCDKAGCYLVV